MPKSDRRAFLKASAASVAGVALPGPVAAALRTPSAAEGPFYPSQSMRFADVDNDLVKILGAVREAGGEIIEITGRVMDRSENPIAGARVEIWQVDTNGRYLHTGDDQATARDPAFQGFGHDITGPDGIYRFRTIKPVSYPGRTPHIHVKVFTDDRELTTQFYIAGHPENSKDGLYRRISKRKRKQVEMVFEPADGFERTVVDIII